MNENQMSDTHSLLYITPVAAKGTSILHCGIVFIFTRYNATH